MRIEFTVQNIPPKKDGANSMWSKDSEAPRIIALRKAAFDEMQKVGIFEPFQSPVKLEFTVFATSSHFRLVSGNYIGDLDTFVTGICDGLQAAHGNVQSAHPLFQSLQNTAIDFRHDLLIKNDAQVVSITAKKVPIDNQQQPYYKVIVEPVEWYGST
jgi:Holliday junction resolvase RusA-like endonuclease